jgi:hypothetical protein
MFYLSVKGSFKVFHEMNITQLEFGSYLTYASHGDSAKILESQEFMRVLKRDGFVRHPPNPPTAISERIAQRIKQNMAELPFYSFFRPNSILVPTPKSSLMMPNTLWIPERIAAAMVKAGIGKAVATCLVRNTPVRKAAYSQPCDRPTAQQHYESMSVQGHISERDEILLVDDIITRGSTLIGSANRLALAFPHCRIRAFGAMRTISNPDEFENIIAPCIGTIELSQTGDTFRRP